MEALERVQNTAGLDGISYKEKLAKPGLFPLELRWLRGDPREGYKALRGADRVDHQKLVPRMEMSKNRMHSLKLKGATFKGEVWGK